jgi:hypothetical protein
MAPSQISALSAPFLYRYEQTTTGMAFWSKKRTGKTLKIARILRFFLPKPGNGHATEAAREGLAVLLTHYRNATSLRRFRFETDQISPAKADG